MLPAIAVQIMIFSDHQRIENSHHASTFCSFSWLPLIYNLTAFIERRSPFLMSQPTSLLLDQYIPVFIYFIT